MLRRRLLDAGAGLGIGLGVGAALALALERAVQPAPSSRSEAEAQTALPRAFSVEDVVEPASLHIVRHGLPSLENVRSRLGYVSSVNFRTRIPNWVAEHLTRDAEAEAASAGADRKHSRFKAEPDVPPQWRATNDDYKGSGFSRGHLAPAGAHRRSQDELDETFLLSSNIVPQELSNNGSDWLRLERFAKGLLKEYSDVWVVSGPLFLPTDASPSASAAAADDADVTGTTGASPAAATGAANPAAGKRLVTYEVIGPHAVAVPTHLFKVVYAEDAASGARRLGAFILPNHPLAGHPDLDDFVVPLAELEALSGLRLLPDVPHAGRVPPMCSAERPCGRGVVDGRIDGWKLLGHIKLSADCASLNAAWAEVEGRGSSVDAMPLMRATARKQAEGLACEWKPPPGRKRGAAGPEAAQTAVTAVSPA